MTANKSEVVLNADPTEMDKAMRKAQNETLRLEVSMETQSKLKFHSAMAVMAAIGVPFIDLKSPRYRPANFWCDKCGCEIPPGKAGRKCKTCRDES